MVELNIRMGFIISCVVAACSFKKMVEKAELSELFHSWPDQLEDPTLDNLIQDLHELKLVKGY